MRDAACNASINRIQSKSNSMSRLLPFALFFPLERRRLDIEGINIHLL